MTYEEQILAEELPGSIVIVGGGAIGVEFAYVLRAYGVDVTIVEYLDRVVPAEDAEVSTELAKQYRKLGITILTSPPGRRRRRHRPGGQGAGHGHPRRRHRGTRG